MIKIYDVPKSGHSHRIRLAASLLKIPFELIPVSELEGERKGETYLALNPFGQVPVIIDDGVVIRDSIAIILYLAEKYAPNTFWVPEDLLLKTQMNEWLAVASGVMFRGPNMARLIKLFGRTGDYQEAVDISNLLFNTMEKHLENREWLVGETPTLADIACYSYLSVANEGELDLSPFEHIKQWLSRFENLDNFIAMPKS